MTCRRQKPLQRRNSLRPRNPERRAKLNLLQFGPYADYIRDQPCVVCDRPAPSDPHHVRSRGAGGRWYDCVPLCRACHGELHQLGQTAFCEERNLDFALLISGLLRRYLIETTVAAPLWELLRDLPKGDQTEPVSAILLALLNAYGRPTSDSGGRS